MHITTYVEISYSEQMRLFGDWWTYSHKTNNVLHSYGLGFYDVDPFKFQVVDKSVFAFAVLKHNIIFKCCSKD